MRMRTTKRALDTRGRLTGATDADGILIPLTNREIETLTRDEVLDFQERRRQQIADREETAREASDFERYKERFVQSGGDPSDARAAWLAKRKADAAEAADRVDAETLEASRRHVRQAL